MDVFLLNGGSRMRTNVVIYSFKIPKENAKLFSFDENYLREREGDSFFVSIPMQCRSHLMKNELT